MAKEKEKVEKPEFEEISGMRSYARQTFYRGLGEDIPQQFGGIIPTYRKLLQNDQVKSAWQQRRRAVTSVNWEVEAGGDSSLDEAAAEFLREQLENIKFDRLTDKMLHGLVYGYMVAECLWAREGNRIILHDIKVRRPERFRLDRQGQLFLTDTTGEEELMPPNKFWCFTDDADNDDDPYGPGLGYYLYWPVFFRKNGAQFWAIYLERYGQPTPMGKFPAGTTDGEVNKILDLLNAIHTDSSVAVPENVAVEFLEAMRSSGADYQAFLAYWDGAIAKVILSQTMTTDNGSSLAQAAVHADVKIEVVRGDADLICESFNNGPARWLTEWNFPGAAIPQVWRRIEEPEDLTDRATREKMISETSGLRPTQEHVEEVYGGKWELANRQSDDEQKKPGDIPPASFADQEQSDIEKIAADVLQLTDHASTVMIDQIKAAMDKAEDLADFAAILLEQYPNIDIEELSSVIAEGLILADLQARGDVLDA